MLKSLFIKHHLISVLHTLFSCCTVFICGIALSHPLDFEKLLSEGIAARQNNQLPIAIQQLSQALLQAPSDPRAALELAVAYEWSSNLLKAEETYRNYLHVDPNSHGAILGLARVLRWRWQFDVSLPLYDKLITTSGVDAPMRLEAQLGAVQIDLMEARPQAAIKRLAKLLEQHPHNAMALDLLEKANVSAPLKLSLSIGQRDNSSINAAFFSMDWLLQQNAKQKLRLGFTHNASSQQLLVTDPVLLDKQNTLYLEQTSFSPQSEAWRWRIEYVLKTNQKSGYQLVADWSDQVRPLWRINAGMNINGPSEQTRRTFSTGISHDVAKNWDSGLTVFLSSGGLTQSEKTLLARLGWTQNRLQAQLFVSRELSQLQLKETAVISLPMGQNQLRVHYQRDGNTSANTWFAGLSIPLDKNMGLQLQSDGNERGWTINKDFSIPINR
jgi:hypothetical protein